MNAWSRKAAESHTLTIWMAGDIAAASLILQRYAAERGMCVSMSPTRFVYTGGCEDGFSVGLINYPRFPRTKTHIEHEAEALGLHLAEQLGQMSFSIVSNETTAWFSRRAE